MLTRRTLLNTGLVIGAGALAGTRLSAAGAATDRRLLMVILRGAADGLAIAAPLADPGYAAARAAWRDDQAKGRKLDALFTLHPALGEFGALYAKGEALVGHALATSVRTRSHFDAQNILETGGTAAYQREDGFLNRLLGLLPRAGGPALALAPAVPLALRGPNRVATFAPTRLPGAAQGLIDRIGGLYAGDAELAALWQTTLRTRAALGESAGDIRKQSADLGTLAGRAMGGTEQARVVMVDLPNWDSHAGQPQQLDRVLGGLDALLANFRAAVGPAWRDTLVCVVTEFGRTVAINGTNGTDHGTGAAALLAGGTVRGGRVVADWPGLARGQLLDGRDLRPTGSTEGFIAGALAEHFALDPARTLAALFPGRSAAPAAGLIA